MTANPELGNVTGTKDKDYDIIWFTETCLSNVLRLEPTSRTPLLPETTNSLISSVRRNTRAAKAPRRKEATGQAPQ